MFGYILCPVESPARQFLDPAHPVDKGLFMHAENLGSLLPRAIVRKESSQRLSKLRIVGGVVFEKWSEDLSDGPLRLVQVTWQKR